jgi:hypothetical protein
MRVPPRSRLRGCRARPTLRKLLIGPARCASVPLRPIPNRYPPGRPLAADSARPIPKNCSSGRPATAGHHGMAQSVAMGYAAMEYMATNGHRDRPRPVCVRRPSAPERFVQATALGGRRHVHPLSLVAFGREPAPRCRNGGWSSRRAVSERTSGTEHSRRQRRLPDGSRAVHPPQPHHVAGTLIAAT